jgi:hypothetical protein
MLQCFAYNVGAQNKIAALAAMFTADGHLFNSAKRFFSSLFIRKSSHFQIFKFLRNPKKCYFSYISSITGITLAFSFFLVSNETEAFPFLFLSVSSETLAFPFSFLSVSSETLTFPFSFASVSNETGAFPFLFASVSNETRIFTLLYERENG